MTVAVVTGAWGPNAQRYVDIFAANFDRHWPKEVALYFATDRAVTFPEMPGRHVVFIPLASCDGWSGFMNRHAGTPRGNGREVLAHWKPNLKATGYNFRFDAVKFAGQAFAPEAAASYLSDGDLLIWLDADSYARKSVTVEWVTSLLNGEDEAGRKKRFDGAYLGRMKHSEIGFWSAAMGTGTRAMIRKFASLYRTDDIFDLREWHSAFVWDHARRAVEATGGLAMRNMTPGGSGHVWRASPLREYLDHLKGAEKHAAR